MRMRIAVMCAVLLGSVIVCWANEPKAADAKGAPAAKADAPAAGAPAAAVAPAGAAVGEPREQTLESRTLLYGSTETTFEKLHEAIDATLPKLLAATREHKIPVAGPVVFVYHNANMDGKPFTIDIGIIVDPEAKDAGDFKVKKLDVFKCDTILLSGPLSQIGEAYGKVMQFVSSKKHEPTGESREFYLYWEGPESPNNVVQIQMGVK